jgi:FMN phosphatase YigB (HAD superfamily)
VRDGRQTLAVDFDGVVHAYTKGWMGGEPYDVPVPGTEDALRQLDKKYKMVIFTARHDLNAVREWLRRYRLSQYFSEVTNRKPQAVAYLDDRAIHFTDWPSALEVL